MVVADVVAAGAAVIHMQQVTVLVDMAVAVMVVALAEPVAASAEAVVVFSVAVVLALLHLLLFHLQPSHLTIQMVVDAAPKTLHLTSIHNQLTSSVA